jgi:hypothetical protein
MAACSFQFIKTILDPFHGDRLEHIPHASLVPSAILVMPCRISLYTAPISLRRPVRKALAD